MKKIITLMLLATLFVVTGCKEEKTTFKEPFRVKKLTDSEECKEGAKDDEQEYVLYKTVNDYYLDMNHINTVFNCCAEELIVTSNLSNDTIYIYENEATSECDCLCEYDLNYEVGPLEYQEYVIKIHKFNIVQAQFTINFNGDTEGTFYIEP